MVLFGACSLFSVVAAWPVSLARYVVSLGAAEYRAKAWPLGHR